MEQVNDDTVELENFPCSRQCAITDISGIELTGDILQKLFFSNGIEPNKWFGQGIHLEKKPDGFIMVYGFKKTG